MSTAQEQEQEQARIASAPAPMATMYEVVYIAPSAGVAWGNSALTRPVTLVEHDTAIVSTLVWRDLIARPDLGPPSSRGSIASEPYLSVPWYNPRTKLYQRIAAPGLMPRPADANAARWYDALTALAWRLADRTTAEPAAGEQPLPTDAAPVAIYGDASELTITTPGLQFRENAEDVRLLAPVVAGAAAFAEQRARQAARIATPLTATELDAIARAEPIVSQLAKEREGLTYRGNLRAGITAAVLLGGAYWYSRA